MELFNNLYNESTNFGEMKIKIKGMNYNYKITSIDITQVFIEFINNLEWESSINFFDKHFFKKSNEDSFVELNLNNVNYELQLEFNLEKYPYYSIPADILNDGFIDWSVENKGFFDYELWKDGEECLPENEGFKINFNEHNILDNIV